MTVQLLESVLLIALIATGMFVPVALAKRPKTEHMQGWVALGALIVFGGVVTGLCLLFFPQTDPGVIFTRAFLIDGIAYYALTRTNTHTKKEEV